MKKKLLFLVTVLSLSFLISCGKNDMAAATKKGHEFIAALKQANPNFVYHFKKINNEDKNLLVIEIGGEGYFAYDMSNYESGMELSILNFFKFPVYQNLTNNGDGTYSCNTSGGTICVPLYKVDPDYINSGFRFEENAGSTKDLEKIAHILEELKQNNISNLFQAEFGLSQERSKNLAKTVIHYQKISNRRALTARDFESFSQNALGVSYAQISNVLSTGDIDENLIEKAARANGVSPEHMGEIISMLLQ